MKDKAAFYNTQREHFELLKQYAPVVTRVHGGNHPEFHEVKKFVDAIAEKAKMAGSAVPELDQEFAGLRAVTGHYTLPDDVCESYEAVYQVLAQLDEAYQSRRK